MSNWFDHPEFKKLLASKRSKTAGAVYDIRPQINVTINGDGKIPQMPEVSTSGGVSSDSGVEPELDRFGRPEETEASEEETEGETPEGEDEAEGKEETSESSETPEASEAPEASETPQPSPEGHVLPTVTSPAESEEDEDEDEDEDVVVSTEDPEESAPAWAGDEDMMNLKQALLERAAENAFQNKDARLASALYDQIEHTNVVLARKKEADGNLENWLKDRKWTDKERGRKVKFESLPKTTQNMIRNRIQKQIDEALEGKKSEKGKFLNPKTKKSVKFESLPPMTQRVIRERLQREVLNKLHLQME